jgi:YHS domain-containing protein
LDGKWTKPKNMGPIINSKAWDSQPALSADGKTLYFASSREGGLGEEDIWITTRSKDGAWSAPKNAGTPINTPERDCFPFLHWDDQTLYHCTDGYPGMGKLDIFFSRKNEKSEWDKPVNLGYPINTPNEETSFIISLDGSTVYFAADKAYINLRDEAPELSAINILDIDIYTFELYEAARPKAVTYVKGTVIDAKTQLPLRAKADIIDLDKNTIVTTTVSDGMAFF